MMLPQNVSIFIKPGITDMRKQINGLAEIVQNDMAEAPLSGALFVFCNRRRDRLKILYWDRNGFCLWLKRLEKDKFPWPKKNDAKLELDQPRLRMLLDGVDFFHVHKTLNFEDIS